MRQLLFNMYEKRVAHSMAQLLVSFPFSASHNMCYNHGVISVVNFFRFLRLLFFALLLLYVT